MTRGGKREGAGRRPDSPGGNRTSILFRIRPEYLGVLDAVGAHNQENRTQTIERAIHALVDRYPLMWPGGIGPYPPRPLPPDIEIE